MYLNLCKALTEMAFLFSPHGCALRYLLWVSRFSTDEGQCWKLYNFTDHPLFFAGLASEPGTKTMNLTIWGYRPEEQYRATWVAVTIDFQPLLDRECEGSFFLLSNAFFSTLFLKNI